MRYLATLLVFAAAVSVASADPVLTWDKAVVGSYDVYTMGVEGDTGVGAWYLDAVFTASGGNFNQEMFNVVTHVDTLSSADSMDGLLGYVKATDTWYYDDNWTECAPDALDIQGTTVITISSLGSKTSVSLFESADMVQFAVDSGTLISWGGVLSYAGLDYPVEGSIPEPMTMSLLVIGGIGVLIRRRRK